jgi:hypothetical protein
MITSRWGTTSKRDPLASDARTWPLHVKLTGRLDWSKLDNMIHPSLKEVWCKHAQYFAVTSALLGTTFSVDSSPADLEIGDIEQLTAMKYVEKIAHTQVKGTVRVFWVAEILKRRRRLVTHPKEQNELPFQKEPSLFPSDEEVFDIHKAPTAACVDMKAFFNQFELPTYLRDYFCFRTKTGEWYRLCTIPTGGRESPIIAQIVLKSLALRIEEASQTKVTAFIDNLRIAGKPHQVEKGLRLLYHICKSELGMQINETFDLALIQSTYTFLGINFKHDKHSPSVALGEGAITRLRATPEINPTTTIRECLVLFGRLIAASRVLGLQPPYHVVKFLRCRVGTPLESLALVWPAIIPTWKAWWQQACENNARPLNRPLGAATLYTDASSKGWGAVMITCGPPRITGARWSTAVATQLHINILETLAVGLAVKTLQLRNCQLTIVLDSTVAIAQIGKHPLATPRGFWLSAAKLWVKHILSAANILTRHVEWIRSDENPADAPSRNEQAPAETTHLLHALATASA